VSRRWVFAGIVAGVLGAGAAAFERTGFAQVAPEEPEDDDAGDASAAVDAATDAGDAGCVSPRAVIDREGHCCLPGQRVAGGACAGAPTSCAPGFTHGEGGQCVRRPAVPRGDGGVLRRERFEAPTSAGVPATMAVVPGGVFAVLGRWLEVGPFAIDRTEVSVGAYRRCVDAGVCFAVTDPFGQMVRADAPVVNVTHDAAMRYCGWFGGRLPTSAEWLLAVRGFEERRYPWGERLADCTLARLAGCGDGAAAVGTTAGDRSEFGVLDGAGNVSEWVLDRDPSPWPVGALTRDPAGAPRGDEAYVRGGSFRSDARGAELTRYVLADPREARVDRGFRCARGL